MIDRYGNAAENANGAEAPSELLFGQTEAYQEYDRAGRLIRGVEKAVPRSKWEVRIIVHHRRPSLAEFPLSVCAVDAPPGTFALCVLSAIGECSLSL